MATKVNDVPWDIVGVDEVISPEDFHNCLIMLQGNISGSNYNPNGDYIIINPTNNKGIIRCGKSWSSYDGNYYMSRYLSGECIFYPATTNPSFFYDKTIIITSGYFKGKECTLLPSNFSAGGTAAYFLTPETVNLVGTSASFEIID